jgi:polysaccharide export outer membrane protein
MRIFNQARMFLLAIIICATCPIAEAQLQSVQPRSGAAGEPSNSQPPSDRGFITTPTYVIAPDDLLQIEIYDVPELSGPSRVGSDGTIKLPMLDATIPAAGKTISQLSASISDQLKQAQLVTDPEVTIQAAESRLHAVSITGSVRNPQLYPLFGTTSLLSLLSESGGLTEDASDTAVVKRSAIGETLLPGNTDHPGETLTVNLKRLLGGDQNENVQLYPGDTVIVQRAGIVYVVGAVNKAGGFPVDANHGEITTLKAVALAENWTSVAKPDKAMIIRRDGLSGNKQIPINLNKIVSGRVPDQNMMAGDILFIPYSAGKRAALRGAEAAVQAATGISIYGRW